MDTDRVSQIRKSFPDPVPVPGLKSGGGRR